MITFEEVTIDGRTIVEITDGEEWEKLPKDFSGPPVYYYRDGETVVFWPANEIEESLLEIETS